MQPIKACPIGELAQLKGVLTDIDDTLTSNGKITAEAFAALENLHRAGLIVIPITGRPAGWCDHFARMWPVDAVVGENGAFWFRYDPHAQRVERRFLADDDTRKARRQHLETVAAEILRHIPGARIASDQRYREVDLAIDYCEDVERLNDAEVARMVEMMNAKGLTAKVSSIHVNAWHGSHDKVTTTLALLSERFDIRDAEARNRFAFIGDSPNDQPMFEHFACSVGVANVRDFAARMKTLPRYVTEAAHGAGFAEFATHVIEAMQKRNASADARQSG